MNEIKKNLDIIGTGLPTYKIIEIEENYIYEFTQYLIKILNDGKYKKKWVPENCRYSFNEKLKIKLKHLKDASKYNFSEIDIMKMNSSQNERLYFVGKLEVDNQSIIIKDKNEEIIKIIPKQDYIVNVKKIEVSNFWYFSKN
ncbi:hypothetical protein NG800_013695 [Epilithonimonas ginsengisoli]|uniref:Uncharacterized protein n=1 Tax=Epilithonimonas ginsengisoli TaxID=1245592 RepID=A0ABU4JJW1_9FLAO|nr:MULTISPECIES: hypothetical protein [Chryseobacterium group]MBV6881042.1 hypothetical protein [Epilithonimonas sp. FP105]MDW8549973.1 hypothetical protein [Epilithonimonas ginsengisoli]OAH76517.1 hypothetical protein AXA65_00550 [Chryseobacterium sp. FP211-J200]